MRHAKPQGVLSGCLLRRNRALRLGTIGLGVVGFGWPCFVQLGCRASQAAEHSSGDPGIAGAKPERAPCPKFASGKSQGRVASKEIDEASGLVASRKNPGVLWVHNDSGDTAHLFALQKDGTLLGTFTLPTARAIDWEDIAFGPGKTTNEPHLYIADTGDNLRRRTEGVFLHRFPEPTLRAATKEPQRGTLGPVGTFRLRYPDGPHDVETLLVEPKTGEVVLLTKSLLRPPRVYYATELKGPLVTLRGGEPLNLEAAGIAALLPTAGDVSPDGRWVIVRSYSAAYLWQRDPAKPLHEAFQSPACPIPLEREPQGEAIGFAADGQGYFTLSEELHQPIFHYALVR